MKLLDVFGNKAQLVVSLLIVVLLVVLSAFGIEIEDVSGLVLSEQTVGLWGRVSEWCLVRILALRVD